MIDKTTSHHTVELGVSDFRTSFTACLSTSFTGCVTSSFMGYRPNCVYGIRGLPSIRKGKVGVYMLWEHVGWLLPGILLVVVYVIPSS
ncbi:hypothetical protein SAMN06298212_13819 [Ruaniaceae bacterium KH17]|nr:hypothetical protein SAMN06298212_13819 [Ruaniaceae bacterium KH17]